MKKNKSRDFSNNSVNVTTPQAQFAIGQPVFTSNQQLALKAKTGRLNHPKSTLSVLNGRNISANQKALTFAVIESVAEQTVESQQGDLQNFKNFKENLAIESRNFKRVKHIPEPLIESSSGKLTISNYSVMKFTSQELESVKSKAVSAYADELKQIQKLKFENQQQPYIENIKTCQFRVRYGTKSQVIKEVQTIKNKRKLQTSDFPQQPNTFSNMPLEELRQHEFGILNRFENLKQVQIQLNNHNKTSKGAGRLETQDYEKIFDRQPTFNEKKAFVNVFRHKWMQDMKYTSMFDRRKQFLQAKGRSQIELKRKMRIEQNLKANVRPTTSFDTGSQGLYSKYSKKQSGSELEYADKITIDWQQIDQLNQNSDEARGLFQITGQVDQDATVKQIKVLNGDQSEQFNKRMLVNEKYRSKSAKFQKLGKFQLPLREEYNEVQNKEVTLKLKGEPAVLNPALQNHNENSLNYFITELCQTGMELKKKEDYVVSQTPLSELNVFQQDSGTVPINQNTSGSIKKCTQKSNVFRNQNHVTHLEQPYNNSNFNVKPQRGSTSQRSISKQAAAEDQLKIQKLIVKKQQNTDDMTLDQIQVNSIDPITIEQKSIEDKRIIESEEQNKKKNVKEIQNLILYQQNNQNQNEQSSIAITNLQEQRFQHNHRTEDSMTMLIQTSRQSQSKQTISQPDITLEQEKMEQEITGKKRTVFNLPQNPLAIRSFKYNFIKNRVENKRIAGMSKPRLASQSDYSQKRSKGLKTQISSYVRNKGVIQKHLKFQQKDSSQKLSQSSGKFVLGADLPQNNYIKIKRVVSNPHIHSHIKPQNFDNMKGNKHAQIKSRRESSNEYFVQNKDLQKYEFSIPDAGQNSSQVQSEGCRDIITQPNYLMANSRLRLLDSFERERQSMHLINQSRKQSPKITSDGPIMGVAIRGRSAQPKNRANSQQELSSIVFQKPSNERQVKQIRVQVKKSVVQISENSSPTNYFVAS